jgi:hypothetical protein
MLKPGAAIGYWICLTHRNTLRSCVKLVVAHVPMDVNISNAELDAATALATLQTSTQLMPALTLEVHQQ